MIKAGTIIHGPDGMAYRVTRDVQYGDALKPDTLEPMNGAPAISPGDRVSAWVARAMINLRTVKR